VPVSAATSLFTDGEVLVSEAVRDAAGQGFRFDARATHVLRGVPGEWRLDALAGGS
jgi:class 3 adenylate cyclase